MPATLLNAPARPVLTRSRILILSIMILAAAALAFVIGGSAARQETSAADRPAFTRRTASER